MTQAPSLPTQPERKLESALPFALFVERFKPITREDGSILWGKSETRPRTDRRQWWTVIEEDRTYLIPGYRSMFSVAYVRCKVPWTGEPHDHPYYRCSTEGKDHD